MSAAARSMHLLDGKYRVLAQLGQGGTANVSLAVARGPSGFSKLVVLKSMKSQLKTEPEFASMFMNEARLAARLNHPNIVQTNEVFEIDGLPVIVMEYLEGQPLSNVIARARGTDKFSLELHLRVLSDALSGLQYSHELCDFDGRPLNVVHRDMSPHNVFVTFDGQVKILDFGIAKLSGSQVETATGVIKGKLRYMPPEQITGEEIDRRLDLFAVGVMLWEAATREKMWRGMSEATIMSHILNGEITPPSAVNPEVAPDLESIVLKALAPEKENRYSTAAELQADLDEFLVKIGSTVRHREIGRAVSEMFEDVRNDTKQVIETQMARVASLSENEYAEAEPIELTGLGTRSGFSSGTFSNGSDDTAQGFRRGGGFWLIALGIVIAVSGIALWQVLKPEPAPADTFRAGTTSSAASEQAAEIVRINITAFPATAKIYLGEELLPSNPARKTFKRSEETRTLVVKAPGYEPEQREVKFDQDAEIVLTLRETQAQEGDGKQDDQVTRTYVRTPRVIPRVTTPPPAPAQPQKPAVDCNPPYYIDARGVKKFKPQCI